MIMRFFNVIFGILFIISAGLQYNDPDPYIWVPIYLYGAWFCYKAARNQFYPRAYAAGLIVYLSYAAFLFFDRSGVVSWFTEHHAENIVQSMKATKPWIEETREFGGLMILVFAFGVNWIYYERWVRRSRSAFENTSQRKQNR